MERTQGQWKTDHDRDGAQHGHTQCDNRYNQNCLSKGGSPSTSISQDCHDRSEG